MSKVKIEDYQKMMHLIAKSIECYEIVHQCYDTENDEFYYLVDDVGCGVSEIDVVNNLLEEGITAEVQVQPLQLHNDFSEVLVTLV